MNLSTNISRSVQFVSVNFPRLPSRNRFRMLPGRGVVVVDDLQISSALSNRILIVVSARFVATTERIPTWVTA